MSSYISYKKAQKWPKNTNRRFSFWYIAILAIIGTLIIIAVVFSIASCKEQRRLEQERAALQRSRDSLEQHLIIPAIPAGQTPATEDAGPMRSFHPMFFKYQQPVVEVYK